MLRQLQSRCAQVRSLVTLETEAVASSSGRALHCAISALHGLNAGSLAVGWCRPFATSNVDKEVWWCGC